MSKKKNVSGSRTSAGAASGGPRAAEGPPLAEPPADTAWWEIPAVAAIALALMAACWLVPRPTGDLYVAFAGARDLMDGKLGQPGGVGVPGNSGAKDRPAAPLVKVLGWFGVRTGGPDDWSFDQPRPVWLNQNWGTHLLFYVAWSLFGKNGVPGLKALLMLTMAGSIVLAARQHRVRWPAAILVAGCAVLGGHAYIDLRPNLILLTLAPMMYWLLIRSRHNPHRIWWAVALILVWGNMHGSFIFGLAMMVLWALCEGLPATVREEPRNGPRLKWACIVGACALAPFGIVAGAVYLNTDIGRALGEPWYWIPALLPLAGLCLVRRAPAPIRAGLRRWWPVLLSPVLGLFLTTVVTLFGLENLSHPLIMGASEQWRQVAEWRPVLPLMPVEYGSIMEFFVAMGLLALLTAGRPLARVAVERRRADVSDDLLIVFSLVVSAYTAVSALSVVSELGEPVRRLANVLQQRRLAPGVPQDLIRALEKRLSDMRALWWNALVPTIVFAAIAVLGAYAAYRVLLSLRQKKEEPSGGGAASGSETSLLFFAVILTGVALRMAFTSRRFVTLCLGLVAPLLSMLLDWVFRQAQRVSVFRYARPAVLLGAVVLVPAGFLYNRNRLHFRADNPIYPPQLNTVFDRMTSNYAYAHGGAEFLNLNGVSGKVMQEWRWEGFLRWKCPQLKVWVGGRAQQAYDEEPYRRRMTMWGGYPNPDGGAKPVAQIRELLTRDLRAMGVQFVIAPLDNASLAVIQPLLSPGSRWAVVYFDRDNNYVLGDADDPAVRDLVERIVSGRARWPEGFPGVGAASRAMCMMSPAHNYPVPELVEALTQACRQMPHMHFYDRLRDMQARGGISLADFSRFLAEQFEALDRPAVPYEKLRLQEVRVNLTVMLADIARQRGDPAGAREWQSKGETVRKRLGEFMRPWRN